MVSLTINFKKKDLFLVLAIGIFIIGMGFVVAFNSNPLNNPNPAVMGHTLDELIVINEDGSQVSLEQYIEDRIGGYGATVCDPTPIYDSMILVQSNGDTGVSYNDDSYKYNNGVKDVPISCKSDAGCVIKQEIYVASGLKLTRQYNFVQYISNKWWSSYRTAGTYLNGDTSSVDVIPAYGSMYLRDDYFKSGTAPEYTKETSSDQFTFIDRSSSYGMKVYICSDAEVL